MTSTSDLEVKEQAETIRDIVRQFREANHDDLIVRDMTGGLSLLVAENSREKRFISVCIEPTVRPSEVPEVLENLRSVPEFNPDHALCIVPNNEALLKAFRELEASSGLPCASISSFLDSFLRPADVLRQLTTGLDKRGRSVLERAGASDLLSDKFIEPDALSESTGIIRGDVLSHLTTTWARGEKQRFVVIHAPAGFGKSMFSHQLAKRLAESYEHHEEWEKPPLPLLIAFGNFRRGSSNFDGLIMERLQQDGPPLVTGDAFRELILHGRVSLILDGFDEMIEANAEVARSNIQNFVSLAGSQARIILTSRSTFFKTRSDVEDQLSSLGLGLDEIEVLELKRFTDTQVMRYVGKVVPHPRSAEKIVRRVLDDSKLGDVLRTPLILKEIVELEREERLSSAVLNRRGILDVLVNKTLEREIERKDLELDTTQQMTFLEELSLELLSRETPDIDQDDLALLSQMYIPQLSDSENRDTTIAKLGNHFYLINAPGERRLVSMHTVWREYFQARALATKLNAKPQQTSGVKKALSKRLLSLPLLDIVADLVEPSNLMTFDATATNSEFRNNWIRLALNCIDEKDSLDLLIAHVDGLSAKHLYDLQFVDRDMRQADFSGSQLMDCRFVNCDLRGANFSGTVLDGVVIRDSKYDNGLRFATPVRFQIDAMDLSHAELLRSHLKSLNPEAVSENADSDQIDIDEGLSLKQLFKSRLQLFTHPYPPGVRPSLRGGVKDTALTRGVHERYTTSIRRHVVPSLERGGLIERSRGRGYYVVCSEARREVLDYLERETIGPHISRALAILNRET